MSQYTKNPTDKQCRETGLAFSLISLLVALFKSSGIFLVFGIFFLIISIAAPKLLKSFTYYWLLFSYHLGIVVSRIFLTLIFFSIVTPVGLIRRGLGKDSMQLNLWKNGSQSVFRIRTHRFNRNDLEHPY